MSSGTTILDGGLATELEARGLDLSDRLWSARVLLTEPGRHRGRPSRLLTGREPRSPRPPATRHRSRGSPPPGSIGRKRFDWSRLSVELASRARARYREEGGDGDTLLVAGSVGPYGAMLADGSEYRGDYDPGAAALADFHRPRIEALVEAGADLLAFETIPTIREAEVLVGLLDDVGTPAWLSYSCRDGRSTSAGEPIEAAVAVGAHPRIVAVGINCTAPRYLPALLAAARTATDLPLIAYPNGGERWDPVEPALARPTTAGATTPPWSPSWAALGATWLGGCCGTGPGDIAALAEHVRAA